MNIHTLKRRTDKDGILRIEVPIGVTDTDVEIVVVIQPLSISQAQNASEKPPRANEPWLAQEEQQLLELYHSGETISAIAREHQRTEGAIRSRLRKLGIDV